MTIASSATPPESAVTVASSSVPSTVLAAPIVEIESADNIYEVASATTSTSSEAIEVLELRAQAAEAAQAAAEARLRLAEARSSRSTSRAVSTVASRAPSVANGESLAEPEHFDISDPAPIVEINDIVVEHGEVVLPTTEPSTRVDQLREFWSSLGRPSTGPSSARPADTIPNIAPESLNALDADARDQKIAELQKQLLELERRTRPTRTSPDGSHHSVTDLVEPAKVMNPIQTKTIVRPPGLDRSEYGTPEGSTADLLGLQPQSNPKEEVWEMDLVGMSEREINLRILKQLDRAEARSNNTKALAPSKVTPPLAANPENKTQNNFKPNENNFEAEFPDLVEAAKVKKNKNNKLKSPPSSPSSSSSSSSTSSSVRAMPAMRLPDVNPKQATVISIKESDSIKLSPLPEAPFWEGWRQQMYDDVAAASGVGHDIFSWLHVVQHPETTFEMLSDSSGRPTLDVKLGSALRRLLRGDLKQQVQTRAKALEKQGRMLRGRQILWMISQQYALDENSGALYNLGDLMNLPYPGDAKLDAFLTIWENQVEGQKKAQPDENLEIFLYEKIKRSELLSTQLRNYERLPQSHPDRSYNYLIQVIRTAVDIQRKEKNRSAMIKVLHGNSKSTPVLAATATEDKRAKMLCNHFARGACTKGKDCPYLHDRKAAAKAKAKAPANPNKEKRRRSSTRTRRTAARTTRARTRGRIIPRRRHASRVATTRTANANSETPASTSTTRRTSPYQQALRSMSRSEWPASSSTRPRGARSIPTT